MATITFDQATLSPPGIVDRSRSDGLIDGSEVTITVDEPGTVSLIDVPEGDLGSASSLTQTGPLVWKFSPTASIYGSWLVEFQPSAANAAPVRRVFAVRSPMKALRVPAFNERASIEATVANGASFVESSDDNEGENYRGWAKSLTELYRTVSDISVPLTTDVTVYVDSVAGNDANAGTQVAPFKTFMRAWVERQKYGVIRARFMIRLLGVGPYSIPGPLGASVCDGYLSIVGDTAAETTHYTGTFSGNFTGVVINTSPGLGTDTHKHRWLRVTSGACAGAELLIVEHTDAQLVVACRRTVTLMGAIVAGDAFKIFVPGTVVNAVNNAIIDWRGGVTAVLTPGAEPRHIFHLLVFTGAYFTPRNSVLCFITCRFANGFGTNDSSMISTLLIDAVQALGASNGFVYRAPGIVASALSFSQWTYAYGPFSSESTFSVANYAHVDQTGGRMSGAITIGTSSTYVASAQSSQDTGYRFDATITASGRSIFRIVSTLVAQFKFAVTAGSCLRASQGSSLIFNNSGTAAATGGTTDAAGFGIDVTGGGTCWFVGVAPTLTGGTSGKDLKTTNNGGVANSVLSAAGTAAGVAADALLGEVLARV